MRHTQVLYADELSKNYPVLYINPPKKWSPLHLLGPSKKIENIKDRLFLHRYHNYFPSGIAIFSKWNEHLNNKHLAEWLLNRNEKNLLFWHFDSYRGAFDEAPITRNFNVKRIYHVIDPFYNNPLNQRLCELAQVIAITSPRTVTKYQSFSHKVLQVPQGLNLEEAKKLQETGKPEITVNRHTLVMLGTISDDLQFDWLDLVLENPGANLIFIGKTAKLNLKGREWETLLLNPRVRYLGLMEPVQFYPILKNAGAGLVLYNTQIRGLNFSPLKALNYLAAALPVLTNVDCEIPGLEDKCIYTLRSESDLRNKINDLLKEQLAFEESAAQAYLKSVELAKLAQDLMHRVNTP